MESWKTEQQRHGFRSFPARLQLAFVAAVTVLIPLPSYAQYAWYSAASVGSDGTVYGWGVTDVTTSTMYHMAYVTTSLTSPKGRKWGPMQRSAQNSVRVDASLPFDPSDIGTYFVQSTNQGFCYAIYAWIVYTSSQASTTLPYVLLSLVTTGTISSDNAGLGSFRADLGTSSLGTRYYANTYWGTGVQVVGAVFPTNFTGSITIHREVREDKIFTVLPFYQQTAPPIYDDTSLAKYRDDNPQSGGSAGKIDDLDAPGIGGVPVGAIYRIRTNYREWAVLNSPALVVSPDLYWFSRVSVVGTSTGDQLKSDVSGDNIAGAGQTQTTWNLQ